MNGAIDAAATQQRSIGRVDDGIDRLSGDVAFQNREAWIE